MRRRFLGGWVELDPGFKRLLILSAVYAFAFGIAIPFEALFLTQRFALGPGPVGGITTAIGLLTVPIQILAGNTSDRWGRKRLMVLGAALSAVGALAFAQAPDITISVVGLLIFGVGGAMFIPVGQAMAGDIAGPEHREREFAWLFASLGLGFALGPLVGGTISAASVAVAFEVAGVLLLLITSVAMWALPETHRPGPRSARQVPNVWQDKRALALCACTCLVWMVGGQLLVTVPIWLINNFGYTSELFGRLIALNGALIAGGQVLLTSRTMRFRATRVLAVGALATGVGYWLMAFSWLPALIVGVLVLSLGEMFLVPTTNAAFDRLAPPGRRGQYQGAGTLFQILGLTMGPLPGGLLLQNAGGFALWTTCLVWAMVTAVGYLVIGRTMRA